MLIYMLFFFSSRRRHTRWTGDSSSDVCSSDLVHRRIVEQRDRGVAVVIVSSELDEIYALADRIAVMYEGKITGFRPPTVSADELGLLMAGAGRDGAPPEAADGPEPSATDEPDSPAADRPVRSASDGQ